MTVVPTGNKKEANDKPSLPADVDSYVYCAVKKCSSLKGPAIFFYEDDCEWLLGQEKDGSKVERKVFDSLVDATKYVFDNYDDAAVAKDKGAAGEAKELNSDEQENQKKLPTKNDYVPVRDEDDEEQRKKEKEQHNAVVDGVVNPSRTSGRKRKAQQQQNQQQESAVIVPTKKQHPRRAAKKASDSNLSSSTPMHKKRKITVDTSNWIGKYRELKQFIDEHGHCNVSQDNSKPSLYNWVNKLREEYSKFQNSKRSQNSDADVTATEGEEETASFLTSQRIKRLLDIGFTFPDKGKNGDVQLQDDIVVVFDEESWHKNINLLRQYKQKYDSVDVPLVITAPDDAIFTGLGSWLRSVRKEMKKFSHSNEASTFMTSDKCDTLIQLGIKKGAKHKDYYFENTDWDKKYSDLVKHKQQHGHCDVTPTSGGKTLYNYSMKLRLEYIKYKNEPSKSILSGQRIAQLIDIGFSFTIPKDDDTRGGKRSWDDMIALLRRYKDKYGHADVPHTVPDPDFNGLGEWVSKCRKEMKKYSEGGGSSGYMTEARYVLLSNDIGVKVDVTRGRKRRKSVVEDIRWDDMYGELYKYYVTHGHCDIPCANKGYKKLLVWTAKMREEYLKFKDGSIPAILSSKRIDALNKIGFQFENPNGGNDNNLALQRLIVRNTFFKNEWDTMVELLHQYREKYGHVDVSGSGYDPEGFEGLGSWIIRVRRHIKKYKNDPTASPFIDDNKMQQLTELGFCFDPVRGRKRSLPPGITPVNPYSRLRNEDPDWQIKWDDMVVLFEKYMEQHGTVNVSEDNDNSQLGEEYPGLGRWIKTVRYYIRQYNMDPVRCPFLNNAKVDQIMNMGFELHPRTAPIVGDRFKLEDENWDTMFGELEQFKQQHGHIKVPTAVKALNVWVNRMKKEYEKMMAGQKSILTVKRIVMLTEIGFKFQKTKKLSFDERAKQWEEYHPWDEITGRRGKKSSKPEELARWIYDLRLKYQHFHNGLETNLTQEQIDKMNGLGFEWESKVKLPPSRRPRQAWEDSLAELVAFKEQRGHCMVPRSDCNLGNWVHSQRRGYVRFLAGDKTHLTTEKIKKLSDVGFAFRASPNKKSSNQTSTSAGGGVASAQRPHGGDNDDSGYESASSFYEAERGAMLRDPQQPNNQVDYFKNTGGAASLVSTSPWNRFRTS